MVLEYLILGGMLFILRRTRAFWMILEANMSILFTHTVQCPQMPMKTGSHQHATMVIMLLLLSEGEMCMLFSSTQKRVECSYLCAMEINFLRCWSFYIAKVLVFKVRCDEEANWKENFKTCKESNCMP
ncbi:hypothetical protein NE237_011981 [Protea cynaroides]|uniref:Uncharacterized protein n=1 Tax=Protea cynaroides TaxID=273540 RepID=A0A9Q0GWP2_9MAGN|nr:hypothetical protein NE237_011981 [Protea cynaroides]